jgi:hypothetical protein
MILLITIELKFSHYITVLLILVNVAQYVAPQALQIYLQVMTYEKASWMSYCWPFYYH